MKTAYKNDHDIFSLTNGKRNHSEEHRIQNVLIVNRQRDGIIIFVYAISLALYVANLTRNRV